MNHFHAVSKYYGFHTVPVKAKVVLLFPWIVQLLSVLYDRTDICLRGQKVCRCKICIHASSEKYKLNTCLPAVVYMKPYDVVERYSGFHCTTAAYVNFLIAGGQHLI